MRERSIPFKGERLVIRRSGEPDSARVQVRFLNREADAPMRAEEKAPRPQEHKPEPVATAPGVPKGNASRAAWRDYAEGLGIDTEGLTRAAIRTAVKEAEDG